MKKYTCPSCGSHRIVGDAVIACDVGCGCLVSGYKVEFIGKKPARLYPNQVLKNKEVPSMEPIELIKKTNLEMFQPPRDNEEWTAMSDLELVFNKQNEIITRLNEITEMMNKKKVTLDEYMEKIPPKRFKTEKLTVWSLPGSGIYHITGFTTKEEAQAALKLLTDNTN